MGMDLTWTLTEVVIASDGMNVSSQLTEAVVVSEPGTYLGSQLLEAVVASPVPTTLTSTLLEVVIATPPAPAGVYFSTALAIENNVSSTDKYVPLTGVWATEQELHGWVYDKKLMATDVIARTLYDTWLGGQLYGLLDGTALEDWQSGVVSGLELDGWVFLKKGDDKTWTPVYRTGSFSIFWDLRALYSDYSFSANVDNRTDSVYGHELTLRDDVVHQSIGAAVYKRDSKGRILVVHDIAIVDTLTGILSGGARLVADDGTTITWSNVETRKKEAVIRDGKLLFNQSFAISVGADGVTEDAVTNTWESHGSGLASGRQIFLSYFPIQIDSIRLASVSASGVVTLWTEKDNLNFSGPTDNHFSVNRDLGIITTGGFKAEDLILQLAIDEFDTEIVCYVDDEVFDTYPQQGTIQIGDEQIVYLDKGRNSFLDCVRGANSTIPAAHLIGDVVSDIQHGASTTDDLYVSYVAIPRVDYEVTSHKLRTANNSRWIDVRPLVNADPNNIVQLSSMERNLASIELTTDRELVGGTLYGPVQYGTDTARLTATAFDSQGNPVDDLNLSITRVSGVGLLNGSLLTYTDVSNSLGQIHAFFNAPYGQDDISLRVTNVQHIGGSTHVTVDGLQSSATPGDVWIFQILKHDPVLGTVGDKSLAFLGGSASPPHGSGFIDVYTPFSEQWVDGVIQLLDNGGIRRTYDIQSVQATSGANGPGTRFFVDRAVDPAIIDAAGNSVWLFENGATIWNPSLLNGARVIVYSWNTEVLHPITGLQGAYSPLHPTSISGNTLVFSGVLLPLPDGSDVENNVGGYVVVAPAETKFQAYGRDPFSGRLIVSNYLRLQLQLPSYLTGVDTSGALPIPQGWTMVTDESNVGGGIGGANFITINPAASGINQFSFTGAF